MRLSGDDDIVVAPRRCALEHSHCRVLPGDCWAIDWPTRRSLVPDLLGKAGTVDGLLLESFLTGFARIIGPALAGGLIASFGAIGCYTGMALLSISALAVMLPLLQVTIARTTKPFKQAPWAALGEGLRYVRSNQIILAVLTTTLIMNLWIFPYNSLLPVFRA